MSLTTTGNNTGGGALVPQNMDQAVRLAEMMARTKTLPAHLQGSLGDCLMVVEQAMRWQMSPFAVAQCTSSIKGKLAYEGKLVAAVVQHLGAIVGHFDYTFEGTGDARTITVSATRAGEAEPKTVKVRLGDAKTDNRMWVVQPDQQLVYHGNRVWARRWTPGPLLGVYTPEEFNEDRKAEAPDTFSGPTIDARAEPVTRETINAEVPITPRKQSISEWLDALEPDLDAAADSAAVDAVIARPDVQKAMDAFKNGARDRLNAMVKAALDRTSVDADAAFLGADERMET